MTTPRTAFPLTLDLDAIHAAFLAEGFEDRTTDRDRANHQRRYHSEDDHSSLVAVLPTATGSVDAATVVALAHDHLCAALEVLVEASGNPHYECGPRNARERALLESLNLLTHGLVATRCACGNTFDGDNLCMPSACAHEA